MMNLENMSREQLISIIKQQEQCEPMSVEEIEQLEWDQSFTLIERVDYGYGVGCYGPL